MKVLVTGAKGFVGCHLVDRLTADGFAVRAHVRAETSPSPWSHVPDSMAIGDLQDEAAVQKMVQGVDAIIHCAARLRAKTLQHFRKDNVDVTNILAQAAMAEGVRRFVHLSSIAVYGLRAHQKTQEIAPMTPGRDGYAITKAEAETALLEHKELDTVILRPGFVWGGLYDDRFMGTIAPMVQRRRFVYPGPCKTPLPFSHVDNVADAVQLALKTQAGVGQAFNITDDLTLSLREFITALANHLDVRPPRWKVPQFLASSGMVAMHYLGRWVGAGQSMGFRPDAIRLLNTECTFSNEAAKQTLDYRPLRREHLS